jgi:hypothetical protein
MEETHLEFVMKNSRRKGIRERYIDAKSVFLRETLSRAQADVDRHGINQDIAFLAMMMYVQDFIAREVGVEYAGDIYSSLAFTGWPFEAYSSLLKSGDLKEKASEAARIFVELERDRIRSEAEEYIKREIIRTWEVLGFESRRDWASLAREVVEEKKRLYRRIGSRADLERRELVRKLADAGARKVELKLLNVGIVPTEMCPSECRFCLAPWKSRAEERLGRAVGHDEFVRMAQDVAGFAGDRGLIITITGGEPILEMERVLHILGIANTRVELTTSGYWAGSVESTHRVLDALERAAAGNTSKNFSFSLQLSVDSFHQEIRRGADGELKEGIPVHNLANIVEAVLTDYDLELCLLPKYTRYEDPLIYLFQELEKRGLRPRVVQKFFDPRLRLSVQGEDGAMVEKPALLKAYIGFEATDKKIFLLYTAVEGIGGAVVMEPFEFPAFKTRTMEFLEQRESQEKFPIIGLEVSDDGNVYPGAHALYSWCLGNLMETSLEEIARLMEYDPLVIALAEDPAAIKNEALEINPGLRDQLEKASSPLVALYKILEDDVMRLKITQRLAENAEGIS